VVPHVPTEDPDTPGVCRYCPLPVDAPNDCHVSDVADIPPAPVDPQMRAAGDREDSP
jgi:hypothetical protein